MKYLLSVFLFIISINVVYSQTKQWKIIWDKNPETDIKEYIVYKDYKAVAKIKSPITLYIDTDIKPGILYSYRIRAVNDKNIPSNYSDPATATIPEFINLPSVLGVSEDKPKALLLKNYINDPDDNTHEITRINSLSNSKVILELKDGNLIFRVNENWTENDIDTVEIKVIDSKEFYNIAKIIIRDESKIDNESKLSSENKNIYNISVFPKDLILSQDNKITFSNIPKKSSISIYDSFGHLVFSEKNISKKFAWDAENNSGDQVLFGMYNFFIYDKNNNIISEGYFRVIP